MDERKVSVSAGSFRSQWRLSVPPAVADGYRRIVSHLRDYPPATAGGTDYLVGMPVRPEKSAIDSMAAVALYFWLKMQRSWVLKRLAGC